MSDCELNETLRKRIADYKCPICGSSDYKISDEVKSFYVNSIQFPDVTNLSSVATICLNCGFVSFFTKTIFKKAIVPKKECLPDEANEILDLFKKFLERQSYWKNELARRFQEILSEASK